MLKELLQSSTVLDLPVVTMLFFIAVFAVVILRVLSRKRRPHYDRMARLPLDDSRNAADEAGSES